MTQEFMPLQKRDDPHPAPPQQVLIQGRVLLERSGFVGHSFSEDDAEVVEFFKNLLAEMGVKTTSGERAQPTSISEKVKARIAQAELFIGIFTRREQIAGSDKWRTSEWLIEEKTHAAALGKKVIVLKERGVENAGGLQGDAEYVEFDRSHLHTAALRLIQMLWSISPGRMTFGKDRPPQLSSDVLEAAIKACPHEPMLRVQLAQVRAGNGQTHAALQELAHATKEFPDYAPVRLELIKGLRSAGRIDEAESEVKNLLGRQPFEPMAHHHLGHILEQRGQLSDAQMEFQKAQDAEPGNAAHFVCLGKMLYRTAGADKRLLREAQDQFRIAIELGGANVEKSNRGYLIGIDRKLRHLPTTRKPFRGKRRKH